MSSAPIAPPPAGRASPAAGRALVGVHRVLKQSIAGLVRRLREDGRAVLLIEHDLTTVFSLCERLIVLDAGRVVADDEPERVRRDARVIAAYLGGGEPAGPPPTGPPGPRPA